MAFDPQCYELAEQFVNDLPAGARSSARVTELAQRIQDVIEDELSDWATEDRERAPDPDTAFESRRLTIQGGR